MLSAAETETLRSSVVRPLGSLNYSGVLALSSSAIHSKPFAGLLDTRDTSFLTERFHGLYEWTVGKGSDL